jgi:hypothetical protein
MATLPAAPGLFVHEHRLAEQLADLDGRCAGDDF